MISFFKDLFKAKRSMANISSNYVLTAVGIVTAIILIPFILNRIGTTQYGIWVILNAVIGYFNFTKLGFNTKMLKDLSEDKGESNKIINSFFFAILLIQLVVLPIVLLGIIWMKVFISPEHIIYFSRVIQAYYLLYATFFFDVMASIFATIIYAKNKHYVANQLSGVKIILNFVLIIGLGYFFRLSIFLLAAAAMTASGLNMLLMLLQSRKAIRFDFGWRFFDKNYVKTALKPSLQYFVISIGALIIYHSDSLVISSFLGAAAVTSYAIGYKLVSIPQKLLWAVPDTLFPKISHLYGNQHWGDLSLLLRKIFSVVVPLNILLSVGLYFFGTDILRLWVGQKHVIAHEILVIFIVTLFFQTIAHTYGVVINAIGKQRLISYMVALEAVLNLAISIALVQCAGVIGVALGTMISHLCVTGWFAMFYTHRSLKNVYQV